MREAALSSVRWTTAGNFLRSVLATVQLLLIARLVPVADFGLIILAVSLLVLGQNISDAGLSSALIRFRDVTEGEKSSLFWLNAIVGATMAAVVYIGASPVARFYAAPQLAPMLQIASIVFLANGLWLQLRVLAERELRFAKLVKLEIASSLLGFFIAIFLAYMGCGAISVVWGQVATSLCQCALAWLTLTGDWHPRLHFRTREVIRFLPYGADMFLVNLATSLTVQLDVLIAGALFPKSVFGSFSQPRDLNMKIMTAINPVITRIGAPLIARHQDDPNAAGRIYLKMIRMSSSVCFPIYASLAFVAQDMLPLILGEKWQPAAALFPFIALWFALRSLVNPIGTFLTALGKSRVALFYQLAFAITVGVSAYIAAHFGPVTLSLAMAGAYLIFAEVSWIAVLRPTASITFVHYHRQFVTPGLCTAGAVLAAYLAKWSIQPGLLGLAVSSGLGGAVFIVLSATFNREGVREIIDVLLAKAAPRTELA